MSQAQKLPDFSLMTKEEMESFIKEQMAKANATIEAQRREHQEQLDKQLKIINNLRQENSALIIRSLQTITMLLPLLSVTYLPISEITSLPTVSTYRMRISQDWTVMIFSVSIITLIS